MSEPSKKVRNLVIARSHGFCEMGGERLPDTVRTLHHRKRRSQGGTNSPSNLMRVCDEHHNLATRSIHGRVAVAYARGWLVESHKDPAEVLVLLHQRWWCKLAADGTYAEASAAFQAALDRVP